MESVAVVVATFGETSWRARAGRSIASAIREPIDELLVEHGATLADARNDAASKATTDWLCFLDADDELEPGYVAALVHGSGDLRAPAVRYVQRGAPAGAPIVYADRDMATINPCVIGTLVRRDMFHAAGGFWREPAWEDWSLFRRCWLLGATIVHHPRAVYRAAVDVRGRNSTVAHPRRLHRDIIRSHERWLTRRC